MNPSDQLDMALEALRQEHLSLHPPASLKVSILQQAEPVTRDDAHTFRNWSLVLATAAAFAIGIILLYSRPTRPAIQPLTATVQPSSRTLQTVPTVIAANPHASQVKRSRSHSTGARHSLLGPTPYAFVLLPTGIGLPEPTQAMLVRTRIYASSLRNYGLAPPNPGAPQTVLAEFLVGEDGLPRAIRLVP